jgi:hypothetical protein
MPAESASNGEGQLVDENLTGWQVLEWFVEQ